MAARKGADEGLAKELGPCFNGEEWFEIMESDDVGFEGAERAERTMVSVSRGAKELFAPLLYQACFVLLSLNFRHSLGFLQILVSSVLLHPHVSYLIGVGTLRPAGNPNREGTCPQPSLISPRWMDDSAKSRS